MKNDEESILENKIFKNLLKDKKKTNINSNEIVFNKNYNKIESCLENLCKYGRTINKVFYDEKKQILYFKYNKFIYRLTINYDINYYFCINYEKIYEKNDSYYCIDLFKYINKSNNLKIDFNLT